MIFIDTETCGLCGPAVIIQWAEDEGPISIHNIWKTPIQESLSVIEMIVNHPGGVCGFNLAFDWFQLNKVYNILVKYPDATAFPEDIIDELAELESDARDGFCLKPVKALDLMLVCRKGPLQALMERDEIKVKKIPSILAQDVCDTLNDKVKFDDIFFARRKVASEPWKIHDLPDPQFKNIVLRFAASGSLKSIAKHILKVDDSEILRFGDISVDKEFNPVELGYAPFAKAIGRKGRWNGAWPQVVQYHADHWEHNSLARKYAGNDVVYTRSLYNYLGKPEAGDTDSELACMVGAVRWHGFAVDLAAIAARKEHLLQVSKTAPKAPGAVRRWLEEVLSPSEKVVIQGSTAKQILAEIAKWEGHPAAERASSVLAARTADKGIDTCNKLLLAGRFHASFNIIGTRSSRMSGSDGFNAQGIQHDPEVRKLFLFKFPGFSLGGGDFDSFEVCIADADYNDPNLHKDLLSGKKIHALFALKLFPGTIYDEVMKDKDKYAKGKAGVFAMIYGGDEGTLSRKQNIELAVAEKAYREFTLDYPMVKVSRERVFGKFQSLKQKGGIGTRIEYQEPADYVESLFGFKRYFTLENSVIKTLFDLAQKPPAAWKTITLKVQRRDRIQTASGACQSAIYAAAFAIQSAIQRAASNHRIQSTGATVTKELELNIWRLQPSGIGEWIVLPFNVHDEVLSPVKIGREQDVEDVVNKTVESYRYKIPLIGMKWHQRMESWAEK